MHVVLSTSFGHSLQMILHIEISMRIYILIIEKTSKSQNPKFNLIDLITTYVKLNHTITSKYLGGY